MDAKEFNRHLQNLHKEEKAIEKLYNFYYRRIILFLSPKCGYSLASDVAQDFFIHLTESTSVPKYVEHPTAWVYRCCENIAKRKITYESRYVSLSQDFADKANGLSYDELYGDIYQEIKKLDDDSQTIIRMYYWEGYNQEEIANILNIKAATVRKKHSRAIKKLKKSLNNVTKFQS